MRCCTRASLSTVCAASLPTCANTAAVASREREMKSAMVVRLRIRYECNEQDIVGALTLDPARADDAVGKGDEHGLEENRRRLGGCTCRVVAVVRFEG